METEQTENKNDSAEKSCEETKFLAVGTKNQSIGPKFGRRHEQMLIFFGLTFLSFCVKVSINMAIVAMTTYQQTLQWHTNLQLE
ncbi:hypothetical protein JTB14_014848 [Gonioctena quinquepunctata]|nr:hypothetical protein JTB14_014848 [Gonioctena quinquepunctata]